MVDVLARSAGAPDAVAVIGPERAWTFAELGAAVDRRVAALVVDAGIEPATAVTGSPRTTAVSGSSHTTFVPGAVRPVITGGTDVDSVVELLACWRAGVVPAPLNARLSEAELGRARAALLGAALPPATQVVLWTSGTAGRPRGVALSFENLRAITDASARRLALGPADVWVGSLSPAHVGGLVLVVRSLLLGGALVAPGSIAPEALNAVLDSRGSRDGVAGTAPEGPGRGSGSKGARPEGTGAGDAGAGYVSAEGAAAARGAPVRDATVRDATPVPRAPPHPTHVSLVPTQLLRLLELRGDRPAPERLACVLVGGAHAPASLVDRALAAGWPVALTYGCTEMSSQIATAPPALVRRKRGVAGPPLRGVDVRVAPDGELLVRGPTRALGYVGTGGHPGPDGRTAPVEVTDADGWVHTGDLGHIDPDGHLRITGRRIDRIVSGGVTIDAVEVEEAVRSHPTVADVCVVGVPDEEWGERVGALVVPIEGEFDPETLQGHLRERLMAAKVPRIVRLAADLPRNANGKVDRAAVRARLSGSRTTHPS